MIVNSLRRVTRGIVRAPRLSAAIVACVALGLTAAGAVFAFVGPALLQPLPFPAADRLVRVWLSPPGEAERLPLSYADVADLSTVRSFERVEASARARLVFQRSDGGRRTEGEAVTPGYFEVLGATPALGRFPDASEYARGDRVLVLSHGAWGAQFGFERTIVGRTIVTNTGPWTVIGVAGPEFGGTVEEDSGDIEFWVPVGAYLTEAARTRRDIATVWLVGRLGETATLAQAAAELRTLSERIGSAHAETRADLAYRVESFGENWRAPVRSAGALLVVAAGLLLLVAAVNVTGLLLARALERRRELAVRIALGASRRRAAAAIVGEAIILVALGGALGMLSGPILLDLFLRLSPGSIPAYVSRSPGVIYMALSLGAVALTALAASAGPAYFATRADPMRVIREGGRGAVGGRSERRWGAALVIAEVAMTVVLAVSAGLLARSFAQLQAADLGFRTERVLRVAFFANPLDAGDGAAIRALAERAHGELAAIPGVEAVARVSPTVPLVSSPDVGVYFDGMPADRMAAGVPAGWFSVDEHFFTLLDIPILAGRGFDGGERPDGARVAVISASLAASFGGAERAVGRRIRRGDVEYSIVGVVADAHFTGPRPDGADGTQLYSAYVQEPSALVSFMLATGTDPVRVVPEARRVLGALAPRSALDWIEPVDEALGNMYARDRFLVTLIGAFSAVTLALAAVGLFAVLANMVARSRGELGLRQALGAAPRRITIEIVSRGVRLVGLGLVIGIPLSFVAARFVRASLFGVGALDPQAWLGAAAALLVTGALASWLPARRAARTSPLEALRAE